MRYEGYQIGPNIRRLRRERKITVDALSDMTGLSVSSINQIEQGGRRLSMDSLYLLMEAFGCDPNTILNIETKGTIDARLAGLSGKKRKYLEKSFSYMLDQAECMTE